MSSHIISFHTFFRVLFYSFLSSPLSVQDNLPAYLEAQLRYRMMDRIKAQLLEFLKVRHEGRRREGGREESTAT